jgi:probable rRNA maturation factor
MTKISINFFSEETTFSPKSKSKLRSWISQTIIQEKHQLHELNFIFSSDDYLLKINQEYLKHDTYTDIITFDNSEEKGQILGDIFISIDRVKENAKNFNTAFQDELHRVMIHGTLHLLGYPDKKKEEKALMTKKENFYLNTRNF